MDSQISTSCSPDVPQLGPGVGEHAGVDSLQAVCIPRIEWVIGVGALSYLPPNAVP